MSKYLDRIKTLDCKKDLPNQVSKVAKAPFDTFDTDQSRVVFENQPIETAGLAAIPSTGFRAVIVKVSPFGCDHVPGRYEAAWQALLAQCPPAVPELYWRLAIHDTAVLFGDFGRLIDEYRWMLSDLFDVPHDGKPGGLIWFIKGSPVVAIGRVMAQSQDGRLWRRASL